MVDIVGLPTISARFVQILILGWYLDTVFSQISGLMPEKQIIEDCFISFAMTASFMGKAGRYA